MDWSPKLVVTNGFFKVIFSKIQKILFLSFSLILPFISSMSTSTRVTLYPSYFSVSIRSCDSFFVSVRSCGSFFGSIRSCAEFLFRGQNRTGTYRRGAKKLVWPVRCGASPTPASFTRVPVILVHQFFTTMPNN